MKNYFIIFAISLIAILSSCSNKNISNSKPHPFKAYSRQLEMNYPVLTNERLQNVAQKSEVFVSVDESNVYTAPAADARFESPSNSEIKHVVVYKNKLSKVDKIKALPQTIVEKMGTKKIEKLLKKQEKQDVNGGQIITGILIGALGLILIALAAAGVFVGSISGLIWVAGVIFFVAGVILVLIGLF
jgi:hypothetical protein